MNKTVLVSFKERNKVLRISTSTVEKEFACLKEQFCRAFNEILSEGQFVTFQRFDSAWDSFVDLEDGDAVEDRVKLKVVIIEGRAESTLAENTSNRDTRTINSSSRDELEVNTEVPESYLPQNEDVVSLVIRMLRNNKMEGAYLISASSRIAIIISIGACGFN